MCISTAYSALWYFGIDWNKCFCQLFLTSVSRFFLKIAWLCISPFSDAFGTVGQSVVSRREIGMTATAAHVAEPKRQSQRFLFSQGENSYPDITKQYGQHPISRCTTLRDLFIIKNILIRQLESLGELTFLHFPEHFCVWNWAMTTKLLLNAVSKINVAFFIYQEANHFRIWTSSRRSLDMFY